LDEVARKYFDKTPNGERLDFEVTAIVWTAAKSKTTSLRRQLAKHPSVANSKLGDQLLDKANWTCYFKS
jgi:hypothetical protein